MISADASYLCGLAAALAYEVVATSRWLPACSGLLERCRTFERWVVGLGSEMTHGDWGAGHARYRELCLDLAACLNASASIARSYESMDEFWADAAAQALGDSPYTFWDSYEHGRRRQLEGVLAAVYESEDALLVNTGMSAIVAAMEVAELRPGDRVLAGARNYFETSEYLENHLARQGIGLLRAPIDQPEAMERVLLECQPRAVLFETSTNSPDVCSPLELKRLSAACPGVMWICDNTVQGTLTPWFAEGAPNPLPPERLVVVESATKYISQSVMAGVVYGSTSLIERARVYARVTGQHLQERGFNHLRRGDILHVGLRLALHSRNTRIFGEELRSVRGLAVRLPDSKADLMDQEGGLFRSGVGGLVFLVHEDPNRDGTWYRSVLTGWQARARACGLRVPVRAGFGWRDTVARIYETGALNQADAPNYLRIAVGIEPTPVAFRLARALRESINDAG